MNDNDISVEQELKMLSMRLENLLDNLDSCSENDVDPELLAQVKASMQSANIIPHKSTKEIVESFFKGL